MQRGHEGRGRQINTSLAGPTAASSDPVTVPGPPRATDRPPPHLGPVRAVAWATTGCNLAGPSTRTQTARRLPQPYTNRTATGSRLLTGHTRTNYRHHSPPKRPRRCQRRQRHKRPNGEPADHTAAGTARHRPHYYRTNSLTANRPPASRPTPNGPDVQGSKREGRPQGWRHNGAPRPPTTTPPNITTHHSSTIIRPTNRRQQPTTPGERELDRVRRRAYASRHASRVARASSSCLTPTENQPRSGCLQDEASGLAPGPSAPYSRG